MSALVASALLFFVLCAPCLLLCALTERRAETLLPLTACGSAVLLYLFGLVGALAAGAYALIALSALCCIAVALLLIQKRIRFAALAGRVCTPGMAVFTLLFLAAIYCNIGRMPYHGDEFSQWAYAVKAMTKLDTFAAAPAAHALYGAYPPGAQLLPYAVQKFYGLFAGAGAGAFCDWLLFLPYQALAFSLLVPFLQGYRWRDALPALAAGAAIFLLPLAVFPLFYESTFVDPLLALLAASFLATLWRAPRRLDALTDATLLALLLVLALGKDAGLALSALCVLALAAAGRRPGLSRRRYALRLAGFAAAIAAAKLSWNAVLAHYGTPARVWQPVELSAVRAFLSGADATAYRGETLQRLIEEFFGAHCPLGTTNLTLFGQAIPAPHLNASYCLLFIALLALLFFTACRKRKGGTQETAAQAQPDGKPIALEEDPPPDGEPAARAARIRIACVVSVGAVAYLAGLAGLYLFKLYEFEALELWCFDRYIGVPLLLLAALLTMLALSAQARRARAVGAVMLALGLAALCPLQSAKTYLSRASAKGSAEMLSGEIALAARITKHAARGEKTFLIAQGTDGEGLALNYLLCPNPLDGASIGPAWYPGDPYAQDLTAAEFLELLRAGGYRCVALARTDAHFKDACAGAFAEPETIAPGELYALDPQTGLLVNLAEEAAE